VTPVERLSTGGCDGSLLCRNTRARINKGHCTYFRYFE
jgi:hypothetical protein